MKLPGTRRRTSPSSCAVRLDGKKLGMAAPHDVGALDPHLGVALLLAAVKRIDDVDRPPCAPGDVLVVEVLPDEAPDRLDAVGAKRRELVELVEVVGEDHVDAVALDPLAIGLERHVGLAGFGHAGLVPDRVGHTLGHA